MAIEKNQRIKAEDVRQGLTIWDPSLEYQVNATCYYANDDEGIPYTIYRNITGNNTSTNPSEDTTNWEALKLGGSSSGSGGANLPMFYNHRFSWKPQDVSWVNSENYSWLYKTPYIGAYDHLVKRYQPTGKFREGNTYYVIIFSDGDIQTTNVTVAGGTVSNLQTWATEKGYTTTGSSIEDLIVSKTLTTETETIAGITITFYRCYDKKKIVLPTEVTNVNAIYAATGIAEYFILDTENLRFKLPRNKWGYYGTGSGDLGDYISESLPNIKGDVANNGWERFDRINGAFYEGNTGNARWAHNPNATSVNTLFFDASRSSSAYQDNAPVQPRGVKGDLYFYLGSADLDEIAEIAGIKAETIDNKADRDLNNVSRNLLSGYEFSVVQENVVANQAYSLDLPYTIDCSKYKVEAVIEFKSAVGNFEVGDRVPLNTCWGQNYRNISYWYNNTKVGFGSSDEISCLPRGTSNGNTNVVGYIRVIFEFYKTKD